MARPKPTSVRFSTRDLWYVEALIEQEYGDNVTDVVRSALWLLVRTAQDKGDIPKKPVRSPDDIPSPEPDDPPDVP